MVPAVFPDPIFQVFLDVKNSTRANAAALSIWITSDQEFPNVVGYAPSKILKGPYTSVFKAGQTTTGQEIIFSGGTPGVATTGETYRFGFGLRQKKSDFDVQLTAATWWGSLTNTASYPKLDDRLNPPAAVVSFQIKNADPVWAFRNNTDVPLEIRKPAVLDGRGGI